VVSEIAGKVAASFFLAAYLLILNCHFSFVIASQTFITGVSLLRQFIIHFDLHRKRKKSIVGYAKMIIKVGNVKISTA
jgi:hypothetical protein